MKTTDCRVGNIAEYANVKLWNKETVGKWTFLSLPDLEQVENYFKPVKITKSVLAANCNFKITRNKAYIVYNEFGNIFSLNIVGDNFELPINAIQVDYLHELQNAFKVLTKQELSVVF